MSKLFQKFGKKATRETAAANNIDYEQVIVSFVKNEISYDQIMEIIRTDDGFLDYLQELIKDDTDYPQEVRENRDALRAELCHIGSVLRHPTLIYHRTKKRLRRFPRQRDKILQGKTAGILSYRRAALPALGTGCTVALPRRKAYALCRAKDGRRAGHIHLCG